MYPDHAEFYGFTRLSVKAKIPNRIFGLPVTEIKIISKVVMYGYFICPETVVLGKNVEIIGYSSFAECHSLRQVLGGENVRIIDRSAFRDCSLLEKVELGQNVETIGSMAFLGCTSLKTVPPLPKLSRIEGQAFGGSGIEEISIPDTMPEVGKSILWGTPWLEKQEGDYVMFGDAIAAYKGTGSKTHVPDNAKAIPQWCFMDNEGLDEVYIPEGVEVIRGNIFGGIDHPVKIYIPKSVSQIAVPATKPRPSCLLSLFLIPK